MLNAPELTLHPSCCAEVFAHVCEAVSALCRRLVAGGRPLTDLPVVVCAQFTVRHLANVFQGLLMGLPDVVNT